MSSAAWSAGSLPPCFVPGFDPASISSNQILRLAGRELALPGWTPSQLNAIIDRINAHRDRVLVQMPLTDIIDQLDRVAHYWLDPTSTYRQQAEAVLPDLVRFSKPVVSAGLNQTFAALTGPHLRTLVQYELQDIQSLDTFRPQAQTQHLSRAYGPRLITHVLAGAIPNPSVVSLFCGLLAKAANLGKCASADPVFPVLFAHSLQETAPDLAGAVAVLWWPGGAGDLEETAFSRAEAVVAYGDNRSVTAIRQRLPTTTRFLGYGQRISLGLLGREMLTAQRVPDLARQFAHDVALYDQQGCLSPHLIYVEKGGLVIPRVFARHLAGALQEISHTLPRGRLTPTESAAIVKARGQAEFQVGTGVFASQSGTTWTVVYQEDTVFEWSPLNRFIRVKPIDDLLDLTDYLAPWSGQLQAVAVAAEKSRLLALADQLAGLGVSRICPPGTLQAPPLTWHHDGRYNLLPLLHWVDLE